MSYIKNGEVAWTKAFGANLQTGTQMRPDMVFTHGTTYESLRGLAAAHGLDVNDYLQQVAETLRDIAAEHEDQPRSPSASV